MFRSHNFFCSARQKETDLPENSVGLVCQGLICKKPSLSKQELLEHLEQSQNRWV